MHKPVRYVSSLRSLRSLRNLRNLRNLRPYSQSRVIAGGSRLPVLYPGRLVLVLVECLPSYGPNSYLSDGASCTVLYGVNRVCTRAVRVGLRVGLPSHLNLLQTGIGMDFIISSFHYFIHFHRLLLLFDHVIQVHDYCT